MTPAVHRHKRAQYRSRYILFSEGQLQFVARCSKRHVMTLLLEVVEAFFIVLELCNTASFGFVGTESHAAQDDSILGILYEKRHDAFGAQLTFKLLSTVGRYGRGSDSHGQDFDTSSSWEIWEEKERGTMERRRFYDVLVGHGRR